MAIALGTMAREGVVAADRTGGAIYRSQPVERSAEGWLRIEMIADLSAMGLPADVPLSATTQPDGSVAWDLGHVPVRTIPAAWTPEEAGEGLGANLLRAAHRRATQHSRTGGRVR